MSKGLIILIIILIIGIIGLLYYYYRYKKLQGASEYEVKDVKYFFFI